MSSYTSLEAELHDAFWNSEESPELEWLDALLTEFPGPALEVGSGSGRLLLPLLGKGHVIEGLEPSLDMLRLCKERAAELGLSPVLHLGTMADLEVSKPYQLVLIPAFTLQLSPDPVSDLARLRSGILTGGILYLSVFIPFAELDGELPEGEWYPDHELILPNGDHASIQTRHHLKRKERTLEREHHYSLKTPEGTRIHRSTETLRWFDPKELQQMIETAGFLIDRAVAEFDESLPVTEDAQIITVVARAI